ncbi:2-octaprenyl-3-methyl-6-methoxy-1,4-benzoquinol hydroxylase [Vibrio sp. SM6]|uniref:2-octaprenyl-3-methyl-6-methoxy-1,4-benzoquinol hydroxylase n=1 Tax=Vibrio agarilyticus TaxID=2726741 RepID=A0A7X8YI41_9VIBR|nr:2-octaprenyl-3-methyl-6-methoxy-1,4-benzoquinol hydroxylase [Vibrio agarilyticus]NLS14186.1 2-octaprenyl-3-methyl-6-methoxy-1,4-benzoquinol hydroxylase [Vibrio agarilyticus]
MMQYDVAIVGGGMVGAALALGLAAQGRRIVMVEGQAPTPFEQSQPMDLRVSAISHASQQLLAKLGAWPHISAMRVCPYRRLETWEWADCRTRFHADALGLSQLGYIIENRVVQLGLWQALTNFPNVTILCPERLADLDLTALPVLTLDSGEQLTAHWVIGADGANSPVRTMAGIGVTAWDYRQHCLLINVETELPQQDITWQWFTPSGPRAFLPLPGNRASLVWYDTPAHIAQLQALNDEHLRQAILEHFPSELGKVQVVSRGAFPLTRRHAQHYVKQRAILVGDAAHTINPLAGQGVNLGFKDVESVLAMFSEATDIEHINVASYPRARRADNLMMQAGMDVFYLGFSSSLPPVKWLRNTVLRVAEQTDLVKTQVLKYAVGLK